MHGVSSATNESLSRKQINRVATIGIFTYIHIQSQQAHNKVIAKKIRKKEKNRKNYTDPCVINLPVFSEPIAAQCSLDKDASALEFSQLYFTDDIMKLLKNWTSVKLNEICGFLALILHISLVVKPKLFDYWSKNLVLSTSFGLGIMPRDRFKSFLKHFLKVSQQMLLPGENLCTDEAICPFRGRISFKVYMKDKPEKYGIKIYAITDTVTGFILNADVYTDQLIVDKVNTVQGIFDRLCENYCSKGHTIYIYIYMDRFYTSPNLLYYLYKKNTLGVKTVRSNRKNLPKDLVCSHLQKNEMTYRRDGSVLCIKWHDKRDIYIFCPQNINFQH
ncbi:hypothetical protein PGB90_000555 [Kerria lacca]